MLENEDTLVRFNFVSVFIVIQQLDNFASRRETLNWKQKFGNKTSLLSYSMVLSKKLCMQETFFLM